MDKVNGIPPGEYAAERLANAQTNLTNLASHVQLSVEQALRLAAVQADMAKAAALLDVAAALRETAPRNA